MTQGLAGYTGVRFPTSNIGFNEAQYLAANPQVAAMVQQGLYPSGRAHYETVGRLQGLSPLTGGNDGQTVAAGLQRYHNNLGLNGQSPFTTTPTSPIAPTDPAAAAPTDASGLAARAPAATYTPAGNGGSGASGDGDGRGGYGNPGTVGDASTRSGIGNTAGRVGQAIGTLAGIGLGVPAVGLAGTALGTAYDVTAANNTLDGRVGRATNPNVGFWDALKSSLSFDTFGMSVKDQAGRALEQQREYDRAVGRSPGMRDAIARDKAATDDPNSLTPSFSPTAPPSYDDVDSFGSQAAATAAANAEAVAAAEAASASAAASETAGMDFSNDGRGGGYGGYDTGGGGYDAGSFASGGFIRALYAMGGLAKPAHMASGGSANIMPWDRVNSDGDAQGLAAWSPYEAASGNMDAGAPVVRGSPNDYAHGGLSAVQPGNNPIHASMGTQVAGPGDGRSDNVPAMLSADEYVIPADVVAALGDGSSNAGAKVLAELVTTTRDQYRRKLGSLPPPKA